MQKSAGIFSNYVPYKVKVDNEKSKKIKTCICPNSNRYFGKDSIRNKSNNFQYEMLRLLLFSAVYFGFRIWGLGVKGAYMKSGDIMGFFSLDNPRSSRRYTNI